MRTKLRANLFFFGISCIIILLVFSVIGFAQPKGTPAAPTAVKPIVWKLQTAYGSVTTCGAAGKTWADRVEKLTGGRLKVEWYEPGALCKIPDIIPGLSKGLFEASYQWGGYYSTKIPMGDIDAGVPMLSTKETGVMQHLWYGRGFLNLVRDAYAKHNIFFLAPNFFPDPYSYGFRGDIKNLAAFKGQKVRSVGMWTDLTKDLGASPTSVPYAEIYMALKLGTVDGAMTCTVSGMMEYKHWEVIKSYFLPSLYYLADNITINMDAWKALPKDIRDLLEEHTRYHFAEWTNRTQWMATLAEQKAKEQGVKFYYYSPEEWEVIKEKFMTVFDKLGKKDEYCAKAVPLVKDTLKEAGLLK